MCNLQIFVHNICMNNKERKIICISYLIYYIGLGIASIISIKKQSSDSLMIFLATITCWILPLLFKCCKLKLTVEMVVINVIFVGLANIGGSICNAYSFYLFDKFLHFFSGMLLCEVAYFIFSFFNQSTQIQSKYQKILCILFINAFHMLLAVLWEFFEYACLILFNIDAIHHYSSGVHDAMGDMLVAFFGGIIVSSYLISFFISGKENFWVCMKERFCKRNEIQ